MKLTNKCTIVALATSLTLFTYVFAQSTASSRGTAEIPKVPNLPLGLPSKNIHGYPPILSEGSIKQLMEDQVPKVSFGCDGQIGRGLGFNVVRKGGCFSQPGLDEGTIHHGGRYLTFFWYNPVTDEIGVFLIQKITRRDDKTFDSFLGERQAFMQLVERIKTN